MAKRKHQFHPQQAAKNVAKPAAPLTREQIVDEWVRQRQGISSLASELRAEGEAIRAAFVALEKGDDEAVRNQLQKIGMQSPFLQWKLFIRGLQAWYLHDDERARDNWQRLAVDRLPFRLAAPFRAQIDAEWLSAQSEQTRLTVKNQLRVLQESPVVQVLRSVVAHLHDSPDDPIIFRMLEPIVDPLRRNQPELYQRLASAMYIALRHADPDQLPRYVRIFGYPAEDPQFNRLRALVFEGLADATSDKEWFDEDDELGLPHRVDAECLHRANASWASFESEIAKNPARWPGEFGALARARIWTRIGHNLSKLDAKEQKQAPHTELACYDRACELAPNSKIPLTHLMAYHMRRKDLAKSINASERYVARFPDEVPAWKQLALLYSVAKDHAKSISAYEQALIHNPLDREVRRLKVGTHRLLGRELGQKNKVEEARPHFTAALEDSDPVFLTQTYCMWAACELKVGNQTAVDELLAKAKQSSPGEALQAYFLVIEANLLSLPAKIRTAQAKSFSTEIAKAVSPELAVALVVAASNRVQSGDRYTGQKTHNKKIADAATKIETQDYSRDQLVALLKDLPTLQVPTTRYRRFGSEAMQRFPKDPWFPYLLAITEMDAKDLENRSQQGLWPIRHNLEKAQDLARRRAKDEPELQAMLQDIEKRMELLNKNNPFAAFSSFFRGFMGFMGEEDDE